VDGLQSCTYTETQRHKPLFHTHIPTRMHSFSMRALSHTVMERLARGSNLLSDRDVSAVVTGRTFFLSCRQTMRCSTLLAAMYRRTNTSCQATVLNAGPRNYSVTKLTQKYNGLYTKCGAFWSCVRRKASVIQFSTFCFFPFPENVSNTMASSVSLSQCDCMP
jgi:hypothetical protein